MIDASKFEKCKGIVQDRLEDDSILIAKVYKNLVDITNIWYCNGKLRTIGIKMSMTNAEKNLQYVLDQAKEPIENYKKEYKEKFDKE